jgi:hypothetical protein
VPAQLVEMDRLDDQPFDPPGLTHASLGEGAEGVAVFLGSARSDRQRVLEGRIVRGQQDTALGLDGKDAIAWGQAEALGHVLGQGCSYGSPDLPESDFFSHCRRPFETSSPSVRRRM